MGANIFSFIGDEIKDQCNLVLYCFFFPRFDFFPLFYIFPPVFYFIFAADVAGQ